MIKTTTVMLRIRWNPDEYTDPLGWDWPGLLDAEAVDDDETGTPVEVSSGDDFVAYVRYIGENLERIASDGWVPVCFEEFVESEERLAYRQSDEKSANDFAEEE